MNIEKEVIEIIADIIHVPESGLSIETEMENVSEWDSMRHMMILTTTQEHFCIEFPEDDIFDLVSVRSIVDEVAKLKA